LLRSGDVSDVGLGNGDVPAGDSGQNSRDEEERERRRHSHKGEPNGRACDAHDQDRAATEPVGKFSEDRREDDLHPGINPGEPANRDRRGVEVLRVQGQHRDDNSEAHQIDEDGEEEDE